MKYIYRHTYSKLDGTIVYTNSDYASFKSYAKIFRNWFDSRGRQTDKLSEAWYIKDNYGHLMFMRENA